MKIKITILAFIFALSIIKLHGQNPISYPKDTLISKPELNFEVLWHTFEDNYAFFKLRKVDWKKTYKKFRPMVNAQTSDEKLFKIFSEMLAPFQDDHVSVNLPSGEHFVSKKPSQFEKEFPAKENRQEFWKVVNKTLYKNGFDSIQKKGLNIPIQPLFTYTTSKDIGYLKFSRCFLDGSGDVKSEVETTSKLLDSIFSNFNNAKGLIIDVRNNQGGYDEFSYEVASRFANKKTIGMYKRTRKPKGHYNELLALETWYIEPKIKFSGPIVLLTNDKTVSAADVFALIMKELPNVTIIGNNSRGIYSDMYEFSLPNNWTITLSNQRYYNSKMVCYEGIGTPVDIKAKNTKIDLVTKNDPVLIKAINILKKKI